MSGLGEGRVCVVSPCLELKDHNVSGRRKVSLIEGFPPIVHDMGGRVGGVREGGEGVCVTYPCL